MDEQLYSIEQGDLLETLDQIEMHLLEYEQVFHAGTDDVSLVHQIFRKAHNLKSLLAMAGKDHSSAVIHIIESHFDALRKGSHQPSSVFFYYLLLAVDHIRSSIIQSPELVEALTAVHHELEFLLHSGTTSETTANVLTISLPEAIQQQIADDIQAGKRLIQVEKGITPKSMTKLLYESLPVYDDIRELGEILYISPSYEEIDGNHDEVVLRIIFSTLASDETIALCIFDPFKPVTSVLPVTAEIPTSKTPVLNSVNGHLGNIVESLEMLELYLLETETLLENNEQGDGFTQTIYQHSHQLRGLLLMSHRRSLASLVQVIEQEFETIMVGEKLSTIDMLRYCLQAVEYIRQEIFSTQYRAEHTDTGHLKKIEEYSTHIHQSAAYSQLHPKPQPAIQHTSAEKLSASARLNNKDDSPQLRILVAEDDPVSQIVLQDILGGYGTCDVVSDGREALLQFQQKFVSDEPYHLVCLDIMMPYLDGLEVLKEIRTLEQAYRVSGLSASKIIMITALNDIHQVFYAFRLQCDAYLTKPISIKKVLYQLKKLQLLGVQTQ